MHYLYLKEKTKNLIEIMQTDILELITEILGRNQEYLDTILTILIIIVVLQIVNISLNLRK